MVTHPGGLLQHSCLAPLLQVAEHFVLFASVLPQRANLAVHLLDIAPHLARTVIQPLTSLRNVRTQVVQIPDLLFLAFGRRTHDILHSSDICLEHLLVHVLLDSAAKPFLLKEFVLFLPSVNFPQLIALLLVQRPVLRFFSPVPLPSQRKIREVFLTHLLACLPLFFLTQELVLAESLFGLSFVLLLRLKLLENLSIPFFFL